MDSSEEEEFVFGDGTSKRRKIAAVYMAQQREPFEKEMAR